jgi:hypothetical protein
LFDRRFGSVFNKDDVESKFLKSVGDQVGVRAGVSYGGWL